VRAIPAAGVNPRQPVFYPGNRPVIQTAASGRNYSWKVFAFSFQIWYSSCAKAAGRKIFPFCGFAAGMNRRRTGKLFLSEKQRLCKRTFILREGQDFDKIYYRGRKAPLR
jgi:hypothetical protein